MEESKTFEELNLDEDILEAVRDLGYETATPIQISCIENLLKGYDLIGQSKTGTGKTAAFAIPMIELIDPDDRRMQGVVLCPTRELCMQSAEEIRKLLKYKPGIRVVSVYGGQPINYQISDMRKGFQIMTATPGRLLDHLRRHTLKLDQVQMVVLDEADEMLDMGFKEDIDLILSQMPEPRQTVLLSATMGEDVKAIAREFMEDPVEIRTSEDDHLTVDEISQEYFDVKAKMKTEALCRLLDLEMPERALIFCNTKKKAAEIAEELKSRDLPADALHGDLKQAQRDLIMRRFRSGDIKWLVATDVAARGLDIHGIDVVFNYDLPDEMEFYVHRIGRTGRAGKTGKSYTFIVGKEIEKLAQIQEYTGSKVTPRTLPTLQEIEAVHKNRLLQEVRQILKGGSPSLPSAGKYMADVEALIADGFDAKAVASALMAKLLYTPSADPLSKRPALIVSDSDSMVKLYFSVGRKQGVRVKDLVGLIAAKCGVPAASVGHIDILETFSYVDVPSSVASDVIGTLDGDTIKGFKLGVQMASSK